MSNEVYQSRPYNQSADVYSFAHLLWEILALEVRVHFVTDYSLKCNALTNNVHSVLQKPYAKHSRTKHRTYVVQRGQRPQIDPSWPKPIRQIIKKAWDPSFKKRPTMKEIRQVLLKELVVLRDGDTTGLQHTKRRRSTFVLEKRSSWKSKERGLDESHASLKTRCSGSMSKGSFVSSRRRA